MKRLTASLCAITLFLLCACSNAPTAITPELADKLIDQAVFSEPLVPLDAEIACFLYQLDPAQLNLTDLTAHRSSGSTCEEVAVLTFATPTDAGAALPVLEGYLSARLADCRDYMPDQVPKLQHAILIQRDNAVLLLVADNWSAAAQLVK